ncbi:Ku protein [Chelativorans alearense]|uniref:non-homologous end joining protein Ku n=1 Tax=Chelativorans alearense TaxID=2681495 RepID=UPI0013D27114|nr:Ku protein [Chelativorans alearense]
MAPRPYWKGYLKLSLVTCAVSLTPAVTEREKVRFHTVNAETGHRARSRYVDAETGEPVPDDEEVRGYEAEEGRYVFIEDEELEAVELESTRTIDIDEFVPADSIEWFWYDKPYYLMPDDEVAEEAYAVIREAMAATSTVGISRLVLSRRERAVMLQPRGKGIILWTLRYGDELRDPAKVYGDVKAKKAEPKLVSLVEALIEDLTRPWDESIVRDPVQERLKEIIESQSKKKTKKPAKRRKNDGEPETQGNVVNIMDALKQSISQEKERKKG